MVDAAELLEVGRVVKAHGLKGELGVKLHWPGSSALEHVSQVVLRKDAQQASHRVSSKRPAGELFLLGLSTISDRSAAEAWRGARILVRRAELPPLAAGEYYLADLVGAEVSAPDGKVGVVVEVVVYPSIECVAIETPAGERLEQPLLPEWVASVDVAAKKMLLSSRDGLIS